MASGPNAVLSSSVVKRLQESAARCAGSAETHYSTAERLSRYKIWLGVPVVEKWSAIRREIDDLLSLHPSYPPTSGATPQKQLEELRERMDQVASESPVMPVGSWQNSFQRAREKYGLAEPRGKRLGRRRRRTTPTAPAGRGSR